MFIFRALMFVSSKFGRKLSAINVTDQDAELMSRVNVELQQYIDNVDHVKYVECLVSVFLYQKPVQQFAKNRGRRLVQWRLPWLHWMLIPQKLCVYNVVGVSGLEGRS